MGMAECWAAAAAATKGDGEGEGHHTHLADAARKDPSAQGPIHHGTSEGEAATLHALQQLERSAARRPAFHGRGAHLVSNVKGSIKKPFFLKGDLKSTPAKALL